ncbi:MAG: flagellar basal body L-ring protein FlgH [bacterium]
MKKLIFLTLILLVLLSQSLLASNSLWDEDNANMYKDRADFKEGDVVTVTIQEDANATQSANTDSSQSSDLEAEGGAGIFDFIRSFGLNYSDEDSADGQTQREGNLEASVTTQVVEIMENGNLKVEGNKKIKINEEEQIINLTGIVRPEDVNRKNNVSSQKVAEASIEYKGEGPIAHKQRSGILSWLFGWLF